MIKDHPFAGVVKDDGSFVCSYPDCHASESEHEESEYVFAKKPASIILGRYYIELIGPNPETTNASFTGPVVATAYGLSNELLKEIEENINTLVPDPFKVVIRK